MTRNVTWHMSATVGLPKWPAVRIWGQPVSQDLAGEIVIRTSRMWADHGIGCDPLWKQKLCKLLNLDEIDWGSSTGAIRRAMKSWQDIQVDTGILDLDLFCNVWLNHSPMFASRGWCSPQGAVRFDRNVGKWPTLEQIAGEWSKISQAWPSLNLEICVMNGELCEQNISSVAVLNVENGQVQVHDPANYQFLSRFGNPAVAWPTEFEFDIAEHCSWSPDDVANKVRQIQRQLSGVRSLTSSSPTLG
jgi:hypothetical protein